MVQRAADIVVAHALDPGSHAIGGTKIIFGVVESVDRLLRSKIAHLFVDIVPRKTSQTKDGEKQMKKFNQK